MPPYLSLPRPPPAHSGSPVTSEPRLTLPGLLRGARAIAPVAAFVVPFGAAFGIAAVQAGVSDWGTVLMSAAAFAGASQFAALDFWQAPVAWLPMLLAVFAINARNILMAAALYPWLKDIPAARRHAIAFFIGDPNFAMAIRAYDEGERDVGLLVGAGMLLWLAWTLGTALGVLADELIAHPERFGLDALMLVFFGVMLVGMWKGRLTALPWAVAAATSLAALWLLPENWHVLAGGLAGGLTGAIFPPRRRQPEAWSADPGGQDR